jgi:hypothetical protein
VADGAVIRILHFRPQRVDFDAQLREQFIPILRSQSGLLDLVAGRHGPDERGPRIVVSVWAADAMVALPPWTDQAVIDPGGRAGVDPPPAEVMPVRMMFRVEPAEPADRARVLRIFRGRVRAGELDAYVDEAANGTQADAASGRGPLALYLATEESTPDTFVTASAWADWSVIEAATGGDVRRPVATRHPERLVDAEATHYEVIEL